MIGKMVRPVETSAGFTDKRLLALVTGNFNRHVNAKHGGLSQGQCLMCTDHLQIMAELGDDRHR
jgi:hypothetical protein